MKKVKKILEKSGIKIKGELHDFWFENQTECSKILDKYRSGWSQEITAILRWRTTLGIHIQNEVIKYIKEKQELRIKESNKLFKKTGEVDFSLAIIDFDKLFIKYNGKKQHVNKWLYTISSNSTYNNWTDLCGINLSNISIRSSIVKNAVFGWANFSKSKINQVEFVNCNFPTCNFDSSFIAMVKFDMGLNNSSFVGAKINAIKIKSGSLGTNPNIKKISYINLLLTAFFARKVELFSGHTDFSVIEVEKGKSGQEQKNISYISWYQDVLTEYTTPKNISDQLLNFLSALCTKSWSSLLAVLVFSWVVIFSFATIYYNISCEFEKGFSSFFTSIYYSVITFTTLGYGDIHPKSNSSLAQFFVILEVFMGYILLGVFLFVLSNRVNAKKS